MEVEHLKLKIMSELFKNDKWVNVVKSTRYSPRAYKMYMRNLNGKIKEIETGLENLETYKKVAKYSYEEWLDINNGYTENEKYPPKSETL